MAFFNGISCGFIIIGGVTIFAWNPVTRLMGHLEILIGLLGFYLTRKGFPFIQF
jgi:hypothetical protein